jgi:GDP-mannose 6-dehydrogenase
MRVAVFGLGYVGCVSASCLANLNHSVVGVDRDEHKISSVNAAISPFYEPGLDELIRTTAGVGTLRATASVSEALEDADVALICVGTPSAKNGNLSLDQLKRVVQDIAAAVKGRSKSLVVAIRSTVFPGTCEDIVIPAFRDNPAVSVVSNPEFLREGIAVKDFMEPGLLVIGGFNRSACETVASLYATLPVQPQIVSLRTAEMIKYSCNAFHAVKVAFANEVGALSEALGIDGREVMATLCADEKLNTSAAYLKPGFAFGGSCLPKDLRALVYRARSADVRLPLLESALPSNGEHLNRGIQAVLDQAEANIGVVGLAFKENTDDLRESPVVTLLEQLIGKGRQVRVYDPHIQLDAIYGANRSFILNAIPHIGKVIQPSFEELARWANVLVVAQKLSPELADAVRASGLPAIDLVGTGLTRLSQASVV